MRKIIYTQNMVVSGLITAIAIMTGFYELTGVKLLIVAVMGFFVLNYLILQGERAWLRYEKNRKGTGAGSFVQGMPWYKMRYTRPRKKNGDSRSITAKVQAGTRHDSVGAASRYSGRDGFSTR